MRVSALESPDLQAPSRYLYHTVYVRPLKEILRATEVKSLDFFAKVRPQPRLLNFQQIFSKNLKSFSTCSQDKCTKNFALKIAENSQKLKE